MNFDKTKTASIAIILMLTLSALIISSSIAVFGQTPVYPDFKTTFTYVEASPNPIGVGQTMFVVWWLDQPPPTAHGAYGDRYEFTVEVTKPDGTKQTMGPYTSDPVGGGWMAYTPESIGTYSFQVSFPGQWITITGDEWYIPSGARELDVGEYYYKPSISAPVEIAVQQDPISSVPPAELPTDYWARPIDPQNREWHIIAGNWLNDGKNNLYTTGPETAHIVWRKAIDTGGLIGGEYGDLSYYTGTSYENKWAYGVVILQGKLYYNEPLSDRTYQGRSSDVIEGQQVVCVDLRTGEELWRKDGMGVNFGQIYAYDSPNQHGAIPYLWETTNNPSSTWRAFDPMHGDWLYSIENVPSGTSAVGPSGELLVYRLNYGKRWLALWNQSSIPELLLGDDSGTNMWQWRPVGKTVDGNNGYSWNVTIPDLPGNGNPTIRAVLDDRIIGDSGMQVLGGRYATADPWTMWAISLKPETLGQLLWLKNYPAPAGNQTMQIRYMDECANLDDGIFLVNNKEKLTLNAYSIDTGNWMWETEPMNAYAMYGVNTKFYDGKVIAAARYAGIIYAYDAETGQKLWEWESGSPGFEAVWTDWPLNGGYTIADDKIYATTSEHSVTMPLYRGWKTFCVDANTGAGLWNITSISYTPAIADGYLVTLNVMDHCLYSNGKGPTKITVAGPEEVQPLGTSVLFSGMVTDESPGVKEFTARFPNGVPAIADEYMAEWMEYLYKQHPCPEFFTGVEVKLETLDPNNNFYEIGRTTTDASGFYSIMWNPPVPGKYTIIATFEGSNSYFATYTETAMGVSEAMSAGQSFETDNSAPEPTQVAETSLISTEVAIIAAIAIAAVIGVVSFWALRKRK